jgi:two-component system NtrC family sensor kinase
VIAIENAALYTSIAQERNKLGSILTNIQDGVIVIDRDQRMVFANKTIQEALRWGEQPIVGRPYRELLTQAELLQLMDTSESTNRAEIGVEDGRVFSAMLSRIADIGTVVSFHDITNLKKLDRIKSDFVSTVSHDLRSPLTAILGYVELLDRVGTVNDMQREFIRRVQVSVHNITTLVDDLLNLGRIEAGFDVRREVVQLDQLIRLALENIRKQVEDKNHQIILEMPAQLPSLLANPVQMRQMIDNLLDNAVKYTLPGGKINLRVATAQKQIIMQIQDAGIGIPAVDLPYIFDKFYRASNSGSDVTGTGLGLAIVKSIIESHNGRIWVESEIGQGTTFTIVLPLTEN